MTPLHFADCRKNGDSTCILHTQRSTSPGGSNGNQPRSHQNRNASLTRHPGQAQTDSGSAKMIPALGERRSSPDGVANNFRGEAR
ncbi:hypothetical protein AVEN_101493-1 [Araneus ventricosus]|uniref:Uncharacterized protein n=1 Tax=Araneus ventricosus TaxID=182803 RepID=A0A4Y2FCY2_ARAVE|nr:hypothetical protein AVEN_101493-1 [Araneus ventricosus]